MNSRAHFPDKWRIPTARLVSTFSLLVLSAVSTPLWATDCDPMSMALHTQAEVDGFQQTYGPCDRVLTLWVEGDDIGDVDGLSALTRVAISLHIQNNPVLANLDGLSALSAVGGDLWIQNNTSLAGVNGLAALTDVGDTLVILANNALTDLDGLSSLGSVGGTLAIRDNPVLTNVDGLSSLVSIGGSDRADQRFLDIRNNAALANLDGLSSLTSIGGYGNGLSGLVIVDNPQLTSIAGLHSLEDIWGSMIISGNDNLTGISGLSALTRVIEIIIQNNASLVSLEGLPAVTNTSSLTISGNGMLNNLDGLFGMRTVWNDLTIQDNINLSDCAGLLPLIDAWDDADPGPGTGSVPDVGGEVFIGGNQSGCNTIGEILTGLDTSRINPGLNDAWYNPETSGQGFFITVFPDLGAASLAWFTYDTGLPPADATANLGDPGHRWLTAFGPVVGNQVFMDIEMTSGGLFDTATEITRTDPPGSDGTLVVTFNSCNSGTVEYDIPSIDRHGVVPIQRVANDNIVLCEALSVD
jgi:hypothetical protein